jgi:protein phosphatase 2C family protein 2/3
MLLLFHCTQIQNEPLIFPPEINMSQGLRRLLSGMLVKDPPARLTLDQVVADVWLQRGDASFPAGAASRPAPPSPLRLAREFQRITISKDEINRAFNTTKTDTGGSGSAATSPKSAAPLHSQLSDVEMRKRGDKFAMSHSRARMSVTIHGGSEASECSDGDESDDWDGENSAVHVTPSKTRSRSHRLDSVEFNSVMDTLGAQPLRSPDTGKVEDTEVLEEITLKGRKFTADPECSNLRLRLRASHHSVQGSRPSQEDRVMVAIDASALEGIQRPYLFEQYALLGIYDGHSGDACASRLQSSLHLTLMSQPSFHAAIPSAMTAACTTVDADICSWCREGGDSSGSTALLICYDARRAKLHVANVGDSRCVLCRAGRAEALTHEHRLFREDEKRRVLRAGGLTHNNRLNGVLAVTRSFGDAHHKEGGEALIATPEITTVAVTADIEFIIMATDGLWDVMDSQPAVNFVRKRLNEHGDLTRCARELTARAMECGSIDNVSAVLFSWNQ